MASSGLPAFDETGNLSPGVYRAALEEILTRFCQGRACILFDRSRAAMVWGICLYWMTTRTDRAPFLAAWQLRRDGGHRGIVEGQW